MSAIEVFGSQIRTLGRLGSFASSPKPKVHLSVSRSAHLAIVDVPLGLPQSLGFDRTTWKVPAAQHSLLAWRKPWTFRIQLYRTKHGSSPAAFESLLTNEKSTYLVRFLVRSSHQGYRELSKILIFLVGPAGLEPATRPL